MIWVGLQITILENKQKLNQCGNILEVVTTAKANFGQLVEKCQTCLFQKDFSSVTFPGGSTDHGIKKIVPAPCHRNGADAKIFYLTQVRSLSTFFTDSPDSLADLVEIWLMWLSLMRISYWWRLNFGEILTLNYGQYWRKKLWYDLKAFSLVKVNNPWVRSAFGNDNSVICGAS